MGKERVTNLIKSQPAEQRAYQEKIKRAEEQKEGKEKEEMEAEYRRNNELLFRSGAKEIFQTINEDFLGGKGQISQRDFSTGHEQVEVYGEGSRGTGEYSYSHHSEVSLKWITFKKNGSQKIENEICVEAVGGDHIRVKSPDSQEHTIYLQGKLWYGYKPTTAQRLVKNFTGIQLKSLRSVAEEVIASLFGQITRAN